MDLTIDEIKDNIAAQVAKISVNRRKNIDTIKKEILLKTYKQNPYLSEAEKRTVRNFICSQIKEFIHRTVDVNFDYKNEIVLSELVHEGKTYYIDNINNIWDYDGCDDIVGTYDPNDKIIYFF